MCIRDRNKDVQQIQEDLPQEKEDNKKEPDKKKQALMGIIKEYNEQYGTDVYKRQLRS